MLQNGVLSISANETPGSVHRRGSKADLRKDSQCSNGCVNEGFEREPDEKTEDRVMEDAQSGRHSVILDLSTVSFVDTVTLKTLKNVRDQSINQTKQKRQKERKKVSM